MELSCGQFLPPVQTLVATSHVMGDPEKVAIHYGIIRHGTMIRQMTAAELEASCRTYVALQAKDMSRAKNLLGCKYSRVEDEAGYIRVYDEVTPEELVTYLYENVPVKDRQDRSGGILYGSDKGAADE